MSAQNEAHGDENEAHEPTERDHEKALETVIETVMNYGQYPATGRKQFDLYEFLLEHHDPSHGQEMLVSCLALDNVAFKDRIERERKIVTELLIAQFEGSEIVESLAQDFATDTEESFNLEESCL